MKTQAEITALQNAANDLGLVIHKKWQDDKRKTVGKYFATLEGKSVSPVLNYDKLNYFLLGWRNSEFSKRKSLN